MEKDQTKRSEYIKKRNDINYCFGLYCTIKGYSPNRYELEVIRNNINPSSLRKLLDDHFVINYIYKEDNLIKLY